MTFLSLSTSLGSGGVSEYQYYGFLAIDRPLTADEQTEVRRLSTRAEITSTRFVNEYHFGDFRGDPTALVGSYHDAHLYFANWGSHRLLLPAAVLSRRAVTPYVLEESLTVSTRAGHLLLDFCLDPDDAEDLQLDEFDTFRTIADFVGLRTELASGDLRPLYWPGSRVCTCGSWPTTMKRSTSAPWNHPSRTDSTC